MLHVGEHRRTLEKSPPTALCSTIQPLPADLVAHIKSAVAITDVADVVVGLLENSLDARSTDISIVVDLDRRACLVEDNGLGIHPESFRDCGGLCKIYHSSKASHRQSVHGGHGVFLASLSTLSLLSATSRHVAHQSTNSLLVHRGRVLSRQTPVRAPKSSPISEKHGTVIDARDIFGNVPVRVKHHARTTQSKSQSDKEWYNLLTRVAGLILAWPLPVSLVVQNRQDPSKRVRLRAHDQVHDRGHSEALISLHSKIKRAPSIFSALRLMPADLVSTFVPASAVTSNLSVKGIISTNPHPTMGLQFVSIGIRPVQRSSDGKVLYDIINEAFARSSFGSHLTTTGDEDVAEPRKLPCLQDIRVRRKGLDRWPVFYLNLEPRVATEVAKDGASIPSDVICKLLEALVDGWLRVNGFKANRYGNIQSSAVPKQSNKSSANASIFNPQDAEDGLDFFTAKPQSIPPSTSNNLKRRRSSQPHTVNSFASWSRIKGGTSNLRNEIWTPSRSDKRSGIISEETPLLVDPPLRPCPETIVVGELGGQSDLKQVYHNPSSLSEDVVRDDSRSDYFGCKHPSTDKALQVSSRTGMVKACHNHEWPQLRNLTVRPTSRDYASRTSCKGGNLLVDMPEGWLSNVLQGWENPVFHSQGGGSAWTLNETNPQGLPEQCRTTTSIRWPYSQWTSGHCHALVQMTKQGLAEAEVISQVDQKFILIRIPSNAKSDGSSSQLSILALVDQHAASERCILESLWATMMAVPVNSPAISSVDGSPAGLATCALEEPIHFQMSGSEAHLLVNHAAHFAAWGILYDLGSESTLDMADAECTIAVTHLPRAFSGRCSQEPRLLIELIREELYTASGNRRGGEATQSAPGATSDLDRSHWLARLSSCPKGILNLLHSRACRSAIMFNDELSREQCQELVSELARCVFPFICAHGRVSMVPLLVMPDKEVEERVDFTDNGNSAVEFVHAMEKWQG